MTYIEFLKIVEPTDAKVAENTLILWYRIYIWVVEHGYADTADSPEFVKYIQSFRQIGVQTIGKHLKNMADLGLLSRHTLRRRLSKDAKEELLNPIVNMFFGGKNLPSSFVRYSLAGEPCSRDFKSAQRYIENIEKRAGEIISNHKPFA